MRVKVKSVDICVVCYLISLLSHIVIVKVAYCSLPGLRMRSLTWLRDNIYLPEDSDLFEAIPYQEHIYTASRHRVQSDPREAREADLHEFYLALWKE